jgi:very-short-patch-repair endonuclease
MRPKLRARRDEGDGCGVGNADQVIAGLAARQRGIVTRPQLIGAGIERGAIKRRLRAGRLHSVHRGVYLVGHAVPPDGAREMAAVLACGAGALVSHRSAAHLWQLLRCPANQPPVDITLVRRDAGARTGIRTHRVRSLDRGDVQTLRGLPLTTPARTLLDLAAAVSRPELERAFAEAQARRLVNDGGIADQLDRNPGRAGVRALRRLVERGPALTRSEAERRMLGLIRAAHLPAPRVNTRLGPYEVDFLWTRQRLVVEVDGYAYHGNRRAFEGDRERDARLAAAGYTVIRITWRQLTSGPEAVVARLAAALVVR